MQIATSLNTGLTINFSTTGSTKSKTKYKILHNNRHGTKLISTRNLS